MSELTCFFNVFYMLESTDQTMLLRSETFSIWLEANRFTNFISSDSLQDNYATFQESTIFDISILNFTIWMDG